MQRWLMSDGLIELNRVLLALSQLLKYQTAPTARNFYAPGITIE